MLLIKDIITASTPIDELGQPVTGAHFGREPARAHSGRLQC